MIRKEHPWEKILGNDSLERTKNLGVENENYRALVHLPPINDALQQRHNVYIHKIGADVLRTKLDEKAEIEMAREALKKNVSKVGKLLRKKIKVSEIADGGVSIAIDQEWDTSTWSEELIEAGCEALILIFHEPPGSSTLERKERAVQMLQKLLQRHPAAETYVRRNIEMLIGKAASRLLKNGQCSGLLDLLYVLHSCKEGFAREMSQFSFNTKALEMLAQEAKCAAVIIQHFFRSKRYAAATKTLAVTVPGFGSERQARMAWLGVVNARSDELRAKWRSMREFRSDQELQLPGGLRGPIHVGAQYTQLVLEIMLHLVSREAGTFAQSNREDVVRANGCTLLATFLAYPTGPFSFASAAVLANVAKASESFEPLLHSGCVRAAVKLIKYLRLVGIGTQNIREKRNARFPMLHTYLRCVDMVTAAGVHAAGLYRAVQGYGHIKEAHEEVERTDYRQALARVRRKETLSRDVASSLGGHALVKELCAMVLHTNHAEVLACVLRCLLTLLCSHCHTQITSEVSALSGVLLMRLTELLHAADPVIGALALCIFLQLGTLGTTRRQLMTVQVATHIVPLLAMTTDHSKVYHQRAVLAAAALCRQCDWRFYDPEELPARLLGGGDVIRRAIYLEVLRTMKAPHHRAADELTVADLVVMPTHDKRSAAMSKAFCALGGRYVAEFVCRPGEENHYERLPLDESAASCAILDGLATHADTARALFSGGMVRFLAKYVYLCKYLFLGRPMADSQIMVLLNGVMSATSAMNRLCAVCAGVGAEEVGRASTMIAVIRSCELVASALFFLNTLSVLHPKLEDSTHELQKRVGVGCLAFMNDYAALLTGLQGRSHISGSDDLHAPASTVVNLIKLLRTVHGQSPSIVVMFDHMCRLLRQITHFPASAYVAVEEWHVVDALRVYLPPPLSGMLDEEDALWLATGDGSRPATASTNSVCSTNSGGSRAHAKARRKEDVRLYRMSLDQLPASFFELCANLCQNIEGVALCLSDGFLRRALDKLVMLNARLRRLGPGSSLASSMANWGEVRLEFLGCLRLVAKCANFHRPQVGSANDLILHRFYSIVEICKALITRRDIRRDDEIVLVAFEVLAALARDTYRVSQLLEQHDVFSVVRHEFLANIEQLPPRGAVAALQMLHYSCFGLTSDYIVRMIPYLREPLSKVARVYPQIGASVREANWTLTKSAMIYRSNVDGSAHVDEHRELSVGVEEYIRTGQHAELAGPLGSRHNAYQRSSTGLGAESDPAGPFSGNSSIATAETPENSPTQRCRCVHSARDLGTVLHCGVSSCGSLRMPAESGALGHGGGLSGEPVPQLEVSSVRNHPAVCEVSQLSAREPGLQRLLAERKGQCGFADKRKVDLCAPQAPSTATTLRGSNGGVLSPLKAPSTACGPASPSRKSATLGPPGAPPPSLPAMSQSPSTPAAAAKMLSLSVRDVPQLLRTRPPPKPKQL